MRKQNAYWTELLAQYKASDLTRPAFCKQHNISYSQFQYHWYRQNPSKKAGIQDFLPSTEPHHFENVAISESIKGCNNPGKDTELVIFLPNQIRCEIKTVLTINEFPVLLKELVALC